MANPTPVIVKTPIVVLTILHVLCGLSFFGLCYFWKDYRDVALGFLSFFAAMASAVAGIAARPGQSRAAFVLWLCLILVVAVPTIFAGMVTTR